MTIEQDQIAQLDEIRGNKGSHFDLAKQVQEIGLVVELDSENNERSEIKLSGCWHADGSDIVVGEVIGDAEAEIV